MYQIRLNSYGKSAIEYYNQIIICYQQKRKITFNFYNN